MKEKENIFLSVLDQHKGIIYKVAQTYCQDRTDQDDLIQEISLQIWLSIERFDGSSKWSTWIYRIALNTSISFYRKHRSRKEKTVRLSPIVELAREEDEAGDSGDFQLLRRLIRELREIDRALMLLHLEGLSSKEIAEVIETTPTNVTTRISRIRKQLRLKFEQHKQHNHGQS